MGRRGTATVPVGYFDELDAQGLAKGTRRKVIFNGQPFEGTSFIISYSSHPGFAFLNVGLSSQRHAAMGTAFFNFARKSVIAMKFKAFENFGDFFSPLYPGGYKGELSFHQEPWSQVQISEGFPCLDIVNREESGFEDTPEGFH